MKILTRDEVIAIVSQIGVTLRMREISSDRDNDGQVIVYLGIYEWDDGTFRDVPDCDEDTTSWE